MRYILPLLVIGGALVAVWYGVDTLTIVDGHGLTLSRSDAVVRAKIERKERKLAGERPENPDARARWRYLQRAGDQGGVTMEKILSAKAQVDEMREAVQRADTAFGKMFGPYDAGLNGWSWLGPGNIGGRVRAIAVHATTTSTTLWIGGVAGGIWKSVDGGGSWVPMNDFLPSLAVTSLVLDPTDPSVLYAGTGESFANDGLPGAGIFKSTDGGQTWTQLAATANDDFRWVNRLAHHPTQSGILFAATSVATNVGVGGEVFKTTDGGQTWTSVLSFLDIPILDVKVHPADGDLVFAGGMGSAWLATEGGDEVTDWTTLTLGGNSLPNDGGRVEVAFAPSDPNMLYVSMDRNQGEVWRSTNQGDTWNLRNTGTNYLSDQGDYDNAIWVSPTNPNDVVVGGIDLWRSIDGGATLTQISDWTAYHDADPGFSAHADQHIILHHPGYNGTSNRTVYVGNDGGIQATNDILTVSLHQGWNQHAHNLGITQFYGGAAAPDGSVIVGGTQDNSHLRYQPADGTQGWYQATTGDGGFAAVDPSDPNIIYGEFQFLQVIKSTDGGSSYSLKTNGLTDAGNTDLAPFIAPLVMDPNNSQILIAGGTSIWRTADGADNWGLIRGPAAGSPMSTAIDIAPSNSNVIWVGYTDGQVLRSTNGGANWNRLDDNGSGLPDRFITDIAIDPFNSSRVFVTLGGYFTDSVWMTEDDGQTWEERTGTVPFDLPELQVNTVRFHPANSHWVYIGTDLGVFASENRGQTWSVTPVYPGVGHEGPVNTEVAELFWQGDYLIAATHGRGMYRTRPLVVVYVDDNASPGGDGTSAHPYDNLHDALAAAGPGTTIHILGGTYPDAPVTITERVHVTTAGGDVLVE